MDAPVIPGCTGKVPYLSWDKANKALSRGHFNERRGGGRMNVYRCRFCHAWHVGRNS